ncbi:sulfotransferase family protein [Thalassobacillus devorans]|uniref:sulfotransferase family protein n=1 Tax=Thalassobacillus devorans TaxID=279813 RepID=UPI00048D5C42|nr:sulfotransferase [Thalassobacillus devorans]
MTYTPVIIIGAGRSGTNMLRDTLTQINGVNTWPCDEINYIWRHHNVTYPNDEFDAGLATERVKRYIRKEFDKMANAAPTTHLVEKTCANSLRVDFVYEVFPEAKYIHIIRDGRDVVESAKKRWTASLDPSYISKKLQFVPKSDLPIYGFRYLWNRVYKLASREKRLAYWGPKFNRMEQAQERYSLEQVCALQWKACVDKAEESFGNIPEEQVYTVYYEELTARPAEEIAKICDFLGIAYNNDTLESITADINNKSVGKGLQKLNESDLLESIHSITNPTLEKHGYGKEYVAKA